MIWEFFIEIIKTNLLFNIQISWQIDVWLDESGECLHVFIEGEK